MSRLPPGPLPAAPRRRRRTPGALGLPLALTALLGLMVPFPALAEPDPARQRLEIHALADQGGREAVEALARISRDLSDPSLQRAVRDAMMRVSLPEATLVELLQSGEDPSARAFAAWRLGRQRGPVAVAALMEAVTDPAPSVRQEVYEALGAAGDRAALTTLIRRAAREPSPALQQVAARAASRIAESRGGPSDVPSLITLLQGGTIEDRRWAAEALGSAGDWRALQPLVAAARSGPPEVRPDAVKALGVLGDPRAVAFLLELLEESGGDVRRKAVGALGILGDESTWEPLVALLGDQDPGVRFLAIRALVSVDPSRAAEALARPLGDPEEPIRTEVIQLLGRLDYSRAAPLLVRALEDPSPFNRAEAARLLGAAGRLDAVEPLLGSLDDGDPLVRLTAAEALGDLGAREAVPRLRRLASRAKGEERELLEEILEKLTVPGPDE